MTSKRKLGELKKGESGWVIQVGSVGYADAAVGARSPINDVSQRLMEMGFLEGSEVELVHEAPFGGDPIAVRVRGSLIALRRAEANQIWVVS